LFQGHKFRWFQLVKKTGKYMHKLFVCGILKLLHIHPWHSLNNQYSSRFTLQKQNQVWQRLTFLINPG
jgi:hypothetical protein